MQNSTNTTSNSVLAMYDVEQLATVSLELEKAFTAKDSENIASITESGKSNKANS